MTTDCWLLQNKWHVISFDAIAAGTVIATDADTDGDDDDDADDDADDNPQVQIVFKSI